MRKVIFSMSVSLDGYIEGPDGDFGWSAPSTELHQFHNERVREVGVQLLGRRLYETMLFWETVEEENPSAPAHILEFARIWKALPKIVYSRTLDSVVGENTRLSREDPVAEARALKEEDGKPIAVGGAELAAALTAHGLVDEYDLFVNPVVVGGGKPFFAGDTPVELELVETRTFGSRVVDMRYEAV
jgi:dihydrofolate reductase